MLKYNIMNCTQFYVITVVKLRFLKINLRLGGSRSKSSHGPPVGHRYPVTLMDPPHTKLEVYSKIPKRRSATAVAVLDFFQSGGETEMESCWTGCVTIAC
jgi:hypothetical protein